MSKRLCSSMLANITHSWGRYLQVQLLLEHIKAIETELRVSREDEERAVALYGEETRKVDRLQDNVVQLDKEKRILIESTIRMNERIKELLKKVDQLIEERELLRKGYTVEQPEKSPDDYVFDQYMEFIINHQYEAADGVLLAIEKLAPSKTDLLEEMRAVERLPF